MVINKDGSKTIMTLVSGKNAVSESDSADSLVTDAFNNSQDSGTSSRVTFNGTLWCQLPDLWLTGLVSG